MLVGYARTSTVEQNEARQIVLFKELGVEKYYLDKLSGKNTDRPQLKEMLSFVRNGDTVVVESISRLARSTRDLLNIVEQLSSKGVQFVSKKESIDTTTPQGRFILTVFAAMAELERESILLRQAEGVAIAKSQGKYHGRKPIDIDLTRFKTVCDEWHSGKISAKAAMDKMNMKSTTFYRKVKELGLEKGKE